MPLRRLAVTTMVVLGLALSTAGVGLAASSFSTEGIIGGSGSAATGPAEGGGAFDPGGGGGALAGESGAPSGVGAEGAGVEQAGGLPRTGLAAIPLFVVGAGLLTSGLVIRRRLSS